MGADLAAHSAAAREVFDRADELFGSKLSTLCFYGPEDALRETINTQPALFVTSVAALRALQEIGAPAPEAVAGHSIGEYAALVAAGALTFDVGFELVVRRAHEMHRTATSAFGTMAAVLGLGSADVLSACEEAEAATGKPVDAANYNGAGQIVISGDPDAVAKAGELAKAKGAKRVLPLNVSGAFHSRLMTPAAEAMAAVLAEANVMDAAVPVVANLTAEYETDAASIRSNLAAQIDHSVRWEETLARLLADGFDTFVEVGSGEVLSGILKRVAPATQRLSAATYEGVQAVGALAAPAGEGN